MQNSKFLENHVFSLTPKNVYLLKNLRVCVLALFCGVSIKEQSALNCNQAMKGFQHSHSTFTQITPKMCYYGTIRLRYYDRLLRYLQ